MWSYDSLIGKARLYFTRAREHPPGEDEVFALWLLLGLEFLLRAPLAIKNPTLLADPTGDSILHAAGFPGNPGSPEPKSIPTHTVISRLTRVVDDFNKDRQDDATILIGLRNKELHTGEAALAVDGSLWLPRFMRIADVICHYLDLDPMDLLGAEVVKHGRALVDAEDRKLAHDVAKRIALCKTFFAGLQPNEVIARRAKLPLRPSGEAVACPACGSTVILRLSAVRTTNEHIEELEIYRDVIYVAQGLTCSVCGLELASTAEIKYAGLQQQYTKPERETIEERFLDSYEPDYGND